MPSALVIGGGGGIGAAVCRALPPSMSIALTYLTHEERARALADELAVGRDAVRALRVDATSEADLSLAFEVAEDLGDLMAVVFCVGGWSYPRISELTIDGICAELNLNLVSALLTLREASQRVKDGGRVVLVSSAAATVAPPRQSVYAAAKAGLEAASRVAAKELAPRGVTVNVVRPGATDTETLRHGTSEKAIDAMSRSNAMRRLGTPDDIAGAILLLLAPTAGWITGEVIDAAGGLL